MEDNELQLHYSIKKYREMIRDMESYQKTFPYRKRNARSTAWVYCLIGGICLLILMVFICYFLIVLITSSASIARELISESGFLNFALILIGFIGLFYSVLKLVQSMPDMFGVRRMEMLGHLNPEIVRLMSPRAKTLIARNSMNYEQADQVTLEYIRMLRGKLMELEQQEQLQKEKEEQERLVMRIAFPENSGEVADGEGSLAIEVEGDVSDPFAQGDRFSIGE